MNIVNIFNHNVFCCDMAISHSNHLMLIMLYCMSLKTSVFKPIWSAFTDVSLSACIELRRALLNGLNTNWMGVLAVHETGMVRSHAALNLCALRLRSTVQKLSGITFTVGPIYQSVSSVSGSFG